MTRLEILYRLGLVLVLLILLCRLLFISYKFQVISFLNSHFGNNLTTKESEKSKKDNINPISKTYNTFISQQYSQIRTLFPQEIGPSLIPTLHINELTKSKFQALTHKFRTPLVVRGFLKDSPAVKKWNLDYFKSRYGKVTLPTVMKADYRKIKNYIRSQANFKYMTLANFINSMERGEKSYVNNVSRIFGLHPELLDDLDLGKIHQYTGKDVKNSSGVTHMFMGGKGTASSLHSSYTGNFFYNVKGRKKWYLIEPKYSRYLLPALSKTGLFAVSEIDIFNTKKGSPVLRIPRYEFTLQEGDLLFNPPWWWHAVRNETPYTIGCANRFHGLRVGLDNNSLYTSILYSHPLMNIPYMFGQTKQEANMSFDKVLLRDILKKKVTLSRTSMNVNIKKIFMAFLIGSSWISFASFFMGFHGLSQKSWNKHNCLERIVKDPYYLYTIIAPLYLGTMSALAVAMSIYFNLSTTVSFLIIGLISPAIIAIIITKCNLYRFTTHAYRKQYAVLFLLHFAIYNIVVAGSYQVISSLMASPRESSRSTLFKKIETLFR